MVVSNRKKADKRNSELSPAAAAVTGAIIGAGVAIAGAVALGNKKNREKVKQVLSDVKAQATGYMEKIQEEVKDKKGNVEKKQSKSSSDQEK